MSESNKHNQIEIVAHGLEVSKNPASGFMERFSVNVEHGNKNEEHTLYRVGFNLIGRDKENGFEITRIADQRVVFHSRAVLSGELDAKLRNGLIETALDQVERMLYPYDLLQINEFLGELDIVRYV